MSGKHTPIPWRVGKVSHHRQVVEIDSMEDGSCTLIKHKTWTGLAQFSGCYDQPDIGIVQAEINARFAVKAVNYHEAMVEALREISELDYKSMENALAWIEDNCPAIRQLLQKLEDDHE